MMKKIIPYILMTNLLLIVLLFIYKKDDQKNISKLLEIEFIKEGELQLKNGVETIKKIDIELATSEQKRVQGLMHRSSMQEDQGMLFIFDEPKPQSFWMKDTRIPLDIIYIDSDSTVINTAKNVPPMIETGVPQSKKPAKFVLEINGGMANQWGVKEGITKINWEAISQP
ncbi:MAG: DUF192 domain-containing protein [Flavobacteriales bacterium AspAUS03]